MALCLANSLVVRRDFIPYDQLVRYKWWYKKGYMSSTGECFDIGAATRQSLDVFERRQKEFSHTHHIPLDTMDSLSNPQLLSQFLVDCSEKGVAGNGALMRLAPVPLFFYLHPKYAVEFSGISGKITHGDQIAYDACRYYGALIVGALHNMDKKDLLDDNFYSEHKKWFNNEPLHPDIMTIAEGSYKKPDGYSAGIRGRGYIVNALEAALWAFCYDDNSFEKGVLAAVNLGDDTDTTAAIYGQLAGAYYGYEGLPSKWLEFVYARSFIQCLSKWIVYEGERWEPEKSQAFSTVSSTAQAQSNATTGSSSKQNRNFNMHTPSQCDLQQGPETSSKNSEGPGSVSQFTHQPIPGIDKSRSSKPSTRLTQSNNNNRNTNSSSNTNGASDLRSASNNPTSSSHSTSTQLQIPMSTSAGKSFRFE
jgi:ADP-ribosylglycohydrolase